MLFRSEAPLPTGVRWLRANYSPEYNEAGEVTGFVASFADITEIRNANALVQRDLTDMSRLRELGAIFATGADVQSLYDKVTDAAIAIAQADGGTVQAFDPKSKELELISARGFSRSLTDHFQHVDASSQTSCGLALATGERTYVDYDVPASEDPDGSLKMHFDEGYICGQSTPLTSRTGEPIGMLSTHWKYRKRLNERDLAFLDLLARQAADLISRRLDEERLKESEERSRTAQRAGGVGIWDWNIAEGSTYWSETTWDFYGETPDLVEPSDEFWTTHIHPEDRERVKSHLLATIHSDASTYRDEFRILRSDGSVLWIESSASVSRDENGRATRTFGVNIDITARREAEERIRASAQQLRLVTDATPALISYVDEEERFKFANQTYTDWFGLIPDELMGTPVREVFGPRVYSVLKPHIRRALAGEDVSFDTELQYFDGPKRFVHVSYTPDIDVDGRVRGYFALTTDLTDLRHSQELLRSSEEKLGLMMETFTDYAILSLDRNGLIESWNIGAKLIFGYDEAEVIGKPGDLLFLPEDRAAGIPQKEMETARESGRALDERWHLRKDGRSEEHTSELQSH